VEVEADPSRSGASLDALEWHPARVPRMPGTGSWFVLKFSLTLGVVKPVHGMITSSG
jgi:hypothetical protein